MFKKTVVDLTNASASANVTPKLIAAVSAAAEGLKVEVGGRRLEFVMGSEYSDPAGLAIDNLAVRIHGVPDNSGQAGEQYWLVHGLDALRCVVDGNISGAPCTSTDYITDINANGSYNGTSLMSDLTGGYLEYATTSVRKPGNETAPILIDDAVYIVRLEGSLPKAFGGIVPNGGGLSITNPFAPGVSWTATRHVIAPAGGTYDQVLQNAVTPNSDDCSKMQTTCAGLPADFYPPLESEIVGEPSQLPFERSWKHYLTLAKEAASEADRLGEELLEHGLRMDERREGAQAIILEACGADPVACGYQQDGSPAPLKPDVYATLGDHDVCLWRSKSNGVICDRTDPAVAGIACPIPLGPNETAGSCPSKIATVFGPLAGDYELEPTSVATLGIVTTKPSQTGSVGECIAFDDLRRPGQNPGETGAVGAEDQQAKREADIRARLMNGWSQIEVEQIAKLLKYEEHFADHYVLRYGDNVIFDTRRPGRPLDNSETLPPCNITAVDQATGSTFWTQTVECYESGKQCNPVPAGVGYDGCPAEWNGVSTELSYDTETAALGHRWAWGFGRLRRAIATLGVMTGQLNKMMVLARPLNPGQLFPGTGGGTMVLGPQPRAGRPCTSEATASEPGWIKHCAPNGSQALKDVARCISVYGDGLIGDAHRANTGRPVNYNGFLPNALPFWAYPDYMVGTHAGDNVIQEWPIVCPPGSDCEFGGVDPQFMYCDIPDPAEIPSSLTGVTPADIFDNFNPANASWQQGGLSSAFIGTASPTAAPTRAASNAWQAAINTMWKPPDSGVSFCSSTSSLQGLQSAVWRAFCNPPDSTDETKDLSMGTEFDPNYMRFGRLPDGGQVFANEALVGSWIAPSSGKFGYYAGMLFDLRKGNFLSEKLPFQYPPEPAQHHGRHRAGVPREDESSYADGSVVWLDRPGESTEHGSRGSRVCIGLLAEDYTAEDPELRGGSPGTAAGGSLHDVPTADQHIRSRWTVPVRARGTIFGAEAGSRCIRRDR